MEDNLSFARKYRPKTLDGYIGNNKIKETVKRLMAVNKKPQSILLEGNTGCGKTTLARIISSWYMCENPNEDGSPCGECFICQSMREYIETGNSETLPDIKEIDVTGKSGKSDMDALIEEIEYPSYGGGWKIYILDECHALSLAGSTRLLKVVEEPPEKTLVIFCTTDPQKMLETLKNRCQLKLKVVKPSSSDIIGLLKHVCLKEGKDYDLQGLRMLAGRADFVIRDSLNFLEQVLNTRGNASSEAVSAEFQEISDNLIFDFYKAFLDKDYFGYINVLYKIRTNYDFKLFISSLTNFTIRGIYIVNNINVEGLSKDEIKSYLNVFSRFEIEDIAYVLHSLKKMPYGDMEANLMMFMYGPDLNNRGSSSVDRPDMSKSKEEKFRNDNIQALERGKLKKTEASLKNSLEEMGIEDAMSLFQLEKVIEEG